MIACRVGRAAVAERTRPPRPARASAQPRAATTERTRRPHPHAPCIGSAPRLRYRTNPTASAAGRAAVGPHSRSPNEPDRRRGRAPVQPLGDGLTNPTASGAARAAVGPHSRSPNEPDRRRMRRASVQPPAATTERTRPPPPARASAQPRAATTERTRRPHPHAPCIGSAPRRRLPNEPDRGISRRTRSGRSAFALTERTRRRHEPRRGHRFRLPAAGTERTRGSVEPSSIRAPLIADARRVGGFQPCGRRL
jgi:hypothetical protein